MKNYHHGNLKESLVNAALGNLHRGVAFEEISLRKLAKDLGVSPAAPYRHFSDNSRFLAAVAYAGFETLLVKLNSAAGETGAEKEFSGPAWTKIFRFCPG
jgi:AcrR family transcriptional regulator